MGFARSPLGNSSNGESVRRAYCCCAQSCSEDGGEEIWTRDIEVRFQDDVELIDGVSKRDMEWCCDSTSRSCVLGLGRGDSFETFVGSGVVCGNETVAILVVMAASNRFP